MHKCTAACSPWRIAHSARLSVHQLKVSVVLCAASAAAAWTSAISLVEPAIAWIVENTQFKRTVSCLWLGLVVWLLGVSVVLSFNEWKDIKVVFNLNIFDTLDKLTSTILLPLGGLLMAIFAGYVMNKNHVQEELNLNSSLFALWRMTNNFIAPIAIFGVFLYLFGVIK